MVGQAALAGEADVTQAVEAAHAAFPAWAALSYHQRADYLKKIGQSLTANDETAMMDQVKVGSTAIIT